MGAEAGALALPSPGAGGVRQAHERAGLQKSQPAGWCNRPLRKEEIPLDGVGWEAAEKRWAFIFISGTWQHREVGRRIFEKEIALEGLHSS